MIILAYLKGQLQGQQERGKRVKWALPAFAAHLFCQTNGHYDRSNRLLKILGLKYFQNLYENFRLFILFLFASYYNTHIVLYQQALSHKFFDFLLDRALRHRRP